VNEVRNQVGQQSNMIRHGHGLHRNASSGSLNGNGNVRQPTPILPRTNSNSGLSSKSTPNGNGNGTPSSNGGVIDLTEDEGGNSVLTQNGVQYRVVNQSGLGQGMQLVSNGSGYHMVSPDGNVRPVVFQQAGTTARATHPPTQAQGQGQGQGQNRPGGGPITIRANHNRNIAPAGPGGRISNHHMSNGNGGLVGVGGRPLAQIAPQPGSIGSNFTLPQLPGPSAPQQRLKGTKEVPPRPELTLMDKDGGIVLSWQHKIDKSKHAEVNSYQIFACQQPLNPNDHEPPQPVWKKVGEVKALPLPMACTLSQFSDENRYHFIVRGLDVYNRSGPFCEIVSIVLKKRQS
jgi:hypothetical protein